MIKIDIITGFLGSGKTTFIKKYAQYLVDQGNKIGIIENDFGAVNVDMMILQEALKNQCDLEMISGGCDQETHQRRLKTKLISLGMLGYDRILIEPSGIFDVDELFDILYEDPLHQWYEVGNVITIVDAQLTNDLSKESNYLLASQVASSGCVILSRCQEASQDDIDNTICHIYQALKQVHCTRCFDENIICKNWDDMTDDEFAVIKACGYEQANYVKLRFQQEDIFNVLYFMNIHLTQENFYNAVQHLLDDASCGKIFRIKGFLQKEENQWLELNATHHNITIQPIDIGQEVVIVIGEKLNKEKIESYWKYK